MSDPVLSVKGLSVYYETSTGDVKAVDDLSFDLLPGETLGFVGESGCGKSTAAMGILQLVAEPGRVVAGQVLLNGTDLLNVSEETLRLERWSSLALIPQGAMNSLNPTMKIGAQIQDAILTHEDKAVRGQLPARLADLFERVGLPGRVVDLYPHELSGGMKQRVCIAMAIALNPAVIIADEATSALDVVVQRVVAQTLAKVRDELGVSMIMIGHDMGLMAQMCDRVAVMYAGQIVEISTVEALYSNPAHPYTQVLIESVPSLTERQTLRVHEGITHDPRDPPQGCIFQLRCPKVTPACSVKRPERIALSDQQEVACVLYQTEEGA